MIVIWGVVLHRQALGIVRTFAAGKYHTCTVHSSTLRDRYSTGDILSPTVSDFYIARSERFVLRPCGHTQQRGGERLLFEASESRLLIFHTFRTLVRSFPPLTAPAPRHDGGGSTTAPPPSARYPTAYSINSAAHPPQA